jgi:AraC-like DNA-binding protein
MTRAPQHRSLVLAAPWRGVHCTYIESGVHFGRHWHDTYGFGVMEHGAHRSASGRGVVDAYAGDVITTNPGEVHDGRPFGGPARRWRIVSVEQDVMAAIAGCVEIRRPVIQDATLARALSRLFRRIERRSEALACEEALVESCVLLMTRYGGTVTPREAYADMHVVRERLAEELLDPPSLAELAAMTGLSRYQVLRRFERTYGVPPHAWLMQQRAERARKLIREGFALRDAAAASGFADQSHMTRLFARHFGFTPGAWRRALQ